MKISAKALFSFAATEREDLSFNAGDIIEILDQNGEWWRGRTEDGRVGFFPFNRVELLGDNTGVSKSEGITSLKTLSPAEKVKKVAVELKDFKKNKRTSAQFEVEVTLQDSTKISEQKTMSDFRRFDDALKKVDPYYVYEQTLSASWADEVPLSSAQAKARAKYLTKYLANNTNGREAFDMLLLCWLESDKNDLKGGTPLKNVVLSSTDTKEQVKRKLIGALCGEYQSKKKDGSEHFENGGSPGEHLGKLAIVKYDWPERDDTEINLDKYEYIIILQEKTKYEGWWYGQKVNGKKGIFPYNYVEVLEVEQVKALFKSNKKTTKTSGSRNVRTADPKSKTLRPMQTLTSIDSRSPSTILQSPKARDNRQAGNESATNLGSRKKKDDSPVLSKNIRSDASSPDLSGSSKKEARERKIVNDYVLVSIDSYDELRDRGVTLESKGKPVKFKKKAEKGPNAGDLVYLTFSAYVWDPQSQSLREFASSDSLKAPPKGVATGAAGSSGQLMEFVIGKGETIDGLEEAIMQMELGQQLRVTIAPKKGYGEVGCPPEIPGNCYLVYDLVLARVLNQTGYKPDRKAIFSVGISKPVVEARPGLQAQRAFKGMQSVNMMKGKDKASYLEELGVEANTESSANQKFSLEELRSIVRKDKLRENGINPKKIEEYLLDSDFYSAFKMDRNAFVLQSAFRKKQLKREAGLL